MHYREMLAGIQRARLEEMLAQLRELDAGSKELDLENDSANQDVKSRPSNFALSLIALDNFSRHVESEKTRLEQTRIALLAKIAAQQTVVMLAQRDYDLLDHLREDNLAEWKTAFDREQEETAAESYLALRGQRGDQDTPPIEHGR